MTANNCSRVKSTAKKLRKNPGRESGGVICGMLTIDAAIHDAVMALPPDERRDRAKVNEAARDGLRLGPLRPAGSAGLYGVPKATE